MRCACIDIGSNTTRLLVAERDEAGALREIASARALNRLAAGRAEDGMPDPARIAAVTTAVEAQVRAAREHGAERIVAVATAVVRGAPAPDELAARLGGGQSIVVLEGDDEARLAFAGATCMTSPMPEGAVAVVDVGGASTEIVVGTCSGGPVWTASLSIGSGALAEQELAGDPPGAADLDRARARAGAALAGLEPPPAGTALAVGGSATAVAHLLGGGSLSRPALARALDALCAEPAAVLGARHAIHPDRMRMLPAGLVILDVVAERLGVELQPARGGLREGVILAMLDGTL